MTSGTHISVVEQPLFSGPVLRLQKASAPPSRPRLAAAVKRGAVLTRKLVSALTLTVPISYFIQFCIAGGLLRAQAFEMLRVDGYMRAVVTPGMMLGNAIFAARMVYNGWNYMFVVFGVVAFVLRHYVMVPFHRFESWAQKRCKPAVPKKAPLLGAPLLIPCAWARTHSKSR